MKRVRSICRLQILLGGLALALAAGAQTVDATAHVNVIKGRGASRSSQHSSADVVIWLTPTQQSEVPSPPRAPQNYTLAQKNKQFIPHILVVRTGSSVDFPNLDPFYHNVFSLFNGKRFDLGLYEAHTHRAVQFDRDGVSYIFCNIHPEMGAVVIALSTPYFGISTRDGLNLWAENVPVEKLNAVRRTVEVSSSNAQLGTFELQASGDIMTHHQNKFGETYPPTPTDAY
jgi:plastocyanin